jgi:hypothetical protein
MTSLCARNGRRERISVCSKTTTEQDEFFSGAIIKTEIKTEIKPSNQNIQIQSAEPCLQRFKYYCTVCTLKSQCAGALFVDPPQLDFNLVPQSARTAR